MTHELTNTTRQVVGPTFRWQRCLRVSTESDQEEKKMDTVDQWTDCSEAASLANERLFNPEQKQLPDKFEPIKAIPMVRRRTRFRGKVLKVIRKWRVGVVEPNFPFHFSDLDQRDPESHTWNKGSVMEYTLEERSSNCKINRLAHLGMLKAVRLTLAPTKYRPHTVVSKKSLSSPGRLIPLEV